MLINTKLIFEITLDDIRSKLNDKNNKLHALIAAKRSKFSWLMKKAPNPSASNVKFKSQSSSFSMVVSDRVCVEKGAPLW